MRSAEYATAGRLSSSMVGMFKTAPVKVEANPSFSEPTRTDAVDY
jgi:hypothetical protein